MASFALYLFGSSVAWGFPYAPGCDIGTIVSQAWSGSVDGAEVVVRNEAQYGAHSRFVLERTRAAPQKAHAQGTAIALVYSGNNEFLHLAPPSGTHGRGPALATAGQRRAAAELHRANIEASVAELRRAGIEVVLSTIPVNLRDWPPSYSVVADGRAAHVERDYAAAEHAALAGRHDEAADTLRELLAVEPDLAQAHFLLGRVLLAAGRPAQARTHLYAANDHDGRPIRATSAINQNIRDIAATLGTRLLDAQPLLEASAGDGATCGNAQFWDDCHPTLEGYVQLADGLGAEIAELTGVERPARPSTQAVRDAHGIDDVVLAGVYGRCGLYCYKHSNCWDGELILRLAERYLRRALAMDGSSVEVHVALILVLMKRGDEPGARALAGASLVIDASRALWLLNGREARSALGAAGITDVEAWVQG